MSILSLISAMAVLVGAGSWETDVSQSLEFEFDGPSDFNLELGEPPTPSKIAPEAREKRGEAPHRFVLNEWTREFCGPDLKLQSGCLVAWGLYEKERAGAVERRDHVAGNAGGDEIAQSIVPVPAAAPLLLSALAGLAFASRGRRRNRYNR